jgi:hypothetical protein
MKDSRKALTINRNPMNSIKSTKKDKDMATIHLQIHSFGKIASWPFVIILLDSLHDHWSFLLGNDSRISFNQHHGIGNDDDEEEPRRSKNGLKNIESGDRSSSILGYSACG